MAETSSNRWILCRNWDYGDQRQSLSIQHPCIASRSSLLPPLLPAVRELGVGNGLEGEHSRET